MSELRIDQAFQPSQELAQPRAEQSAHNQKFFFVTHGRFPAIKLSFV